jgi:hypothetical protein
MLDNRDQSVEQQPEAITPLHYSPPNPEAEAQPQANPHHERRNQGRRAQLQEERQLHRVDRRRYLGKP